MRSCVIANDRAAVLTALPDKNHTRLHLADIIEVAKSDGKKNGRKAHSVVRRCPASQHRQDALPARKPAGEAYLQLRRKKRPREVAFRMTLVAGAGFEPATFGL
jgi:hypothetical protein